MKGLETMGKITACIMVLGAMNTAANPLYGLKTREVMQIVRSQMQQGHCDETPAIQEAKRRIIDDEMTDSEEAEFLDLARQVAQCKINNEFAQK